MTNPYNTNDNAGNTVNAPRGVDGTAYGRVLDADAYYNAPVSEPLPEAEADKGDKGNDGEAVVDDRPALAGVGPEFDTADSEPQGVDMSTLPDFKDMRRMLPSERLKVQMNTAKVATALPAHLKNADTSQKLDLDALTSEDLDALTGVIANVETTVLDNAADRDAMTEWLVNQDNSLNAVMAAFSTFTKRLGN